MTYPDARYFQDMVALRLPWSFTLKDQDYKPQHHSHDSYASTASAKGYPTRIVKELSVIQKNPSIGRTRCTNHATFMAYKLICIYMYFRKSYTQV